MFDEKYRVADAAGCAGGVQLLLQAQARAILALSQKISVELPRRHLDLVT
jgi:hypothetical protein